MSMETMYSAQTMFIFMYCIPVLFQLIQLHETALMKKKHEMLKIYEYIEN